MEAGAETPAADHHAHDACTPEPIDLPPPFTLVTAARSRRRLCPCAAISRRRMAPARWSMSAASISRNLRLCWSPMSRCARRGAPSMPAWWRWPMRLRAMRRRTSRSTSTGRTRSASMAAWSAADGWPGRQAREEDEPPPWLVFGAMIRTVAMGERGARRAAARRRAGRGRLRRAGRGQVVESFARHLMVAFDAWQREGFGAVAQELPRPAVAAEQRRAPRIDDNGDLLMRRMAARRGRAARRCCHGWPRRPGSIRRPEDRAVKLLRTIALDPSDTFVFDARGGARRMGGVGRVPVLRPRSGRAAGQGSLGLPQRLSRRAIARLVDAGADRRGDARTTARNLVELLAQQLVDRISARRISQRRAPRPKRKSPLRLALHASGRHSDCGAPHRDDGEVREAFRRLQRRRGPPSRCARSRSWRSRTIREPDDPISVWPSMGREPQQTDDGFLDFLRPSSARPRRRRRARASPMSS